PQILLTRQELFTMPLMVSLLNGDIYRTEYGAIYLGLLLTVLPLMIVYFILSKYIVEGVALGGVKS
ncbi:MAG: carbohydrate ABC transporter permease, partial [Ruminococcus sp.]|nr:carbohydrate ABC transporter permease [Ruminococcus sp.]